MSEIHKKKTEEHTEIQNEMENAFGSDALMPNEESSAKTAASVDSAPQGREESLEEEVRIMRDQLMRALAEVENVRKRAQREREDASKFAISAFARDLVNVADNLRRALDSTPADLLAANPQIKNLTDGIEATERELLRSFEKNGIVKLTPLDQPFDPNFHEVMFEAPMPNKAGGTVIQVVEAGYTLNGRILRPARVGIARSDNASGTGQTIDTQA